MSARLLLSLGFVACSVLLGAACAPSSIGSASEKGCHAGFYVYDVERPTVDAAYASKMAELVGVHGTPQSDGGVWILRDGLRVVMVQMTTGGIRYYDFAKRNSSAHIIDPSTFTAEDAKRVASESLRSVGLLPSGATISRVSLSLGPAKTPSYWDVFYDFRIPARVTASCTETTAPLRSPQGAVFVGDDGLIGLEWDCPKLTRRPTSVPAIDYATEGLQVEYHYLSFSENPPHLDPIVLTPPWGRPRPATRFSPELVEDHAKTPSFVAGSEIRVAAPAVENGTTPYTYRWQAQLAGLPNVKLSESPSLTTRLPGNTVGLVLRVTDAEGMWVERSYQVGLR